MYGFQRFTGGVVIRIGCDSITGVAVHGEDRFTFIGVDQVDQSLLNCRDELGIVYFGNGLGDRNGVVVDTIGYADDIELVPDGVIAAHACLAGSILLVGGQQPGIFIVAAAVGIAHNNINRFGGSLCKRFAITGEGDDAGEIGELFTVIVIHQPQGGIDVPGGRGCLQHGPAGGVQIIPW